MATASCTPSRTDLPGRIAAVLAGATALAHLATATAHGTHVLTTALLVVMTVVCLLCSRHLWLGPSPATFATAAVTTTLMLVLHLPLPSHDHSGHHAAVATAGGGVDVLMTIATALALCELLITVTVFFARTRAVPEAVLRSAA